MSSFAEDGVSSIAADVLLGVIEVVADGSEITVVVVVLEAVFVVVAFPTVVVV
ncbi:MAG: Uncharacterised protein [Acidimicrobiaceae bacterium]|nr:MAG: Uncharacterised protein [Acidimicrobiaceae bacterium]